MNKKLKKLLLSLFAGLIISVCFALAACGSDPLLKLSEEELSLFAGESHTLTVDVKDINENLVWRSSDETVLSVTPSGDGKSATVYAFKAGNASVTVAGGDKEATCNVTVSEITTVSSIEITYDGSADVKLVQGATLSFAKLKAQTTVDGLQYRFTIKHGDGAEQDLTADFTLSDKGVYTVTAYVVGRGYTGSDTLDIAVAESVTDLTVQYGSGDEALYVNQTLKFDKITASSATAAQNNVEIGYKVTLPDGSAKELTGDLTLKNAGEYVLEAYLKGNTHAGSAKVTLNVLAKASLSSKMTIKYRGTPVTGNLEHEISTAYDLSKFTVETEGQSGVVYTWKLNGEEVTLADEAAHTFNAVNKYTLTASFDEITFDGEKSVEIIVYKNHTLTLGGANKALVNGDNSYAVQAEATGLNYKYEVSYDGGTTYTAYNGAFTSAGAAKIKASVSDASTLNRGEAVMDVTVYELGNTYTVKAASSELSLILGTGKRASDKSVAASLASAQNDYTVEGGTPATCELVSFNEEVATVSGDTATAVSDGTAKIYAILDGKAYYAYDVTVKTYANYYVIQDVADVNAVKNASALTYVLANDIDLNGRVGSIVGFGASGNEIGFSGIFDGNGHTLKNGVLKFNGTNDQRVLFGGAFTGTLKNTAFIGWETEGNGSGWVKTGLLGEMNNSTNVENVYIDMTVNSTVNSNCYGILGGYMNWSSYSSIKNVLINATYKVTPVTDGNNVATLVGSYDAANINSLENVYIIVNGGYEEKVSSSNDVKNYYSLNYASLEALQTAKPELFAEGGVFATGFWKECIVDINRPVFKVNSLNVFVGEEFTEEDIFLKNAAGVTVSEPAKLGFASGKFTANASGSVTLTVNYNGENISMTVVISDLATITDAQLSYNSDAPLAVGSTIDASKFEVTSSTVGGKVEVKDYKIKKTDGADFVAADGYSFTLGGTYTVTAVVTHRGYTGTLSFELTIERGVEITGNFENANLTLYPTISASGAAYSDNSKKTATLSATAKYTDNNEAATISSYKSSNEAVATVAANGTITAVGGGTCDIIAVVNGKEYKACTVAVTSYADYKAIATLADVNNVQNNAAGKYLLVDDIDLNSRVGSIVNNFSGIFDGNGHALKNGYLDIAGTRAEDKMLFFGEFKGTLKNILIIGFNTSAGTNNAGSGWQNSGLLRLCDNSTVRNVYIEMTVNCNGTQNCNGILSASYWSNNANVSNVIINATYTGEFKKFGTVGGGLDTKKMDIFENVYALVNGDYATKIPSNCQDDSKTLNYASLSALQAAKPELFAEGGVFTGEFWQNAIYYINGGMSFKNLFKEVFAGETFNLADIVNSVDGNATLEVTSGTDYLGFASGTFTAKAAGTAVVTLTSGAHVEKLTVTVKPQNALSDITLVHGNGNALQLGDKLIKANLVATSTSKGTLDASCCVYSVTKDGTAVEWSDGEITLEAGSYVLTLSVTDHASGLVGSMATLSFTVSAEVITVTNTTGTGAKLYAEASLEKASGGNYNLAHTATLSVTATSSIAGNTPTISGYKSSDEAVATVSSAGVITAVAQGTATVYAVVNGVDYSVFTVNVVSFAGYKALEDLADINAVASNAAGKYLLVNDIDLNGRVGSIVNNFTGIFDGNGHAIKNGELKISTNVSTDKAFFHGDFTGTLQNISFVGWNTEAVQNTSWQACGLISTVAKCTIKNVYIEMTVQADGKENCNGILGGSGWNQDSTIQNVIINATYTGEFTKFATVMGGFTVGRTFDNVYAVVSGSGASSAVSNCQDGSKTLNYASLEALQTAKPELFAEGGVFATEFWNGIIEGMQTN